MFFFFLMWSFTVFLDVLVTIINQITGGWFQTCSFFQPSLKMMVFNSNIAWMGQLTTNQLSCNQLALGVAEVLPSRDCIAVTKKRNKKHTHIIIIMINPYHQQLMVVHHDFAWITMHRRLVNPPRSKLMNSDRCGLKDVEALCSFF